MALPRAGTRSPQAWRPQIYQPPPISTSTPQHPQIPTTQRETLKSDATVMAIPAPAYIDLGAVKHEKEGYDRRDQLPASSTASTPVPSLVSPASMYSGPPPPYSSCYSTPPNPPQTVTSHGHPSYQNPSDPRRESDKERGQEQPRQSLPSISQALEQLTPSFDRQNSTPQHVSSAAAPPPASSSIGQAPGSTVRFMSHAGLSHPTSLDSYSSTTVSQHSSYSSRPSEQPGPLGFANGFVGSPRPLQRQQPFSPTSPTDPTAPRRLTPPYQHAYTSTPTQPQVPTSTVAPLTAPSMDSSSSRPPFISQPAIPPLSQPPMSQGLPQAQPLSSQAPFQPDLRTHQPGGAYSFPPPATSGLTYEQSLAVAAQHQQQQYSWVANVEREKVEEQRRQAAATLHAKRGSMNGGGNYGVTVKRHLDDFDLENNLNEIAHVANELLQFSRDYGVRAHQYPRSTLPVTELPDLRVCDEMIRRNTSMRDALDRVRSIVESGQQLAADQARQQQEALGKSGMVGGYGGAYGAEAGGYSNHAASDLGDDKAEITAGGFAGGDAKKRRGRNAPPGRCHSCNRAETPEWRRGPDGARTLCNACGLHYAKLTRKMGVKTGQPSGSNLRPKNGEDTTS